MGDVGVIHSFPGTDAIFGFTILVMRAIGGVEVVGSFTAPSTCAIALMRAVGPLWTRRFTAVSAE